MKLITVTGYKGGCGKSTTAVHLATYFSDYGKTLLIQYLRQKKTRESTPSQEVLSRGE